MTAIFVSGCSLGIEDNIIEDFDMEYVVICEADSDCMVADGFGCCGCPVAINKLYDDWWEGYIARKENECDKERVFCSPCGPSEPIGAECVENVCQLMYQSFE